MTEVTDIPVDTEKPVNRRIDDENIIGNYMEDIKKYISDKQLNLKDLIYHNIVWNKSCYDQKRVKTNNNWWIVAQNEWANTQLFLSKYLNLNINDTLSGNYYNLSSYNVTTYTADNYKAVEYKVYSSFVEKNNVMNNLITVKYIDNKNTNIYVTFEYFYKGLTLFTLSNKDIYNNIDPAYIRCKQQCKSDFTLTNTVEIALSWWLGVEKIFYNKYQRQNFPANSAGLVDTIALSIDSESSLINCIKTKSLTRSLANSRSTRKKDIKYLLEYIMKPENNLVPKFIDHLLINDPAINELLDNFIENGFIGKDIYNKYLNDIKKQNELKASEGIKKKEEPILVEKKEEPILVEPIV